MEDETRKGRIKRHFIENKKVYFGVGVGVGIAGISLVVMKSCSDSSISHDIVEAAKRVPDVPGETSVNALEVNRGGLVLGNSYALNNVSFFSAQRQGPPSWVVRCLETGNVFTSQNSAASEMGLSGSELSKHLNGMREDVQGYHFERICMAA